MWLNNKLKNFHLKFVVKQQTACCISRTHKMIWHIFTLPSCNLHFSILTLYQITFKKQHRPIVCPQNLEIVLIAQLTMGHFRWTSCMGKYWRIWSVTLDINLIEQQKKWSVAVSLSLNNETIEKNRAEYILQSTFDN